MSRYTTIRRRVLLGAGVVLALAGLSLLVAHASLVRRIALARIQTYLRETQGLALEARSLDYNLLSSRFELKDVAIQGNRLADLPAPLKAQRVAGVIPLWRMLRGSIDTAEIRIDGLSVHLITGSDGRSNFPSSSRAGKGDWKSGLPAIQVTSAEVYVQDDQTGFSLRLAHGRLSARWDPSKREYGVTWENTGGQLQSRELRLVLDRLQLKSVFAKGAFAIESLRLVSGESHAEIRGSVTGSPSRIDAVADLDLNMRHLSDALALSTPMRGRLQTNLSASGPVESLQLKAALRGEDVNIGGVPIRRPVAEALFDAATGEVEIRSLSAGLFSGRLTGKGKISTGGDRGRSEFTASLTGLDPRQVAGAFGASGFPAAPAAVQFTAYWPGLNWRRAAISGVARSEAAKVAFEATAGPGVVRASLVSSLGDSAGMNGDIVFGIPSQALSGTVHGEIPSLARFGGELENLLDRPAGSFTGSAVDGSAHWSATLGGTARLPTASLQIGASGLSIGRVKGADLKVEAEYAADHIAIESARLAWGGQQIDAKGEIGSLSSEASLRLDGTVQGRSLAAVFENLGGTPAVEGAVSGEFRIRGTVANPAAEASLRATKLTAFGEQLARVNLDARWQGGELTLGRLVAEQDHESGAPGRVEASGSLDAGTGRYVIEASGQNLRPGAVMLSEGLPLTGAFQFEVHGKGTLSDPALSAQVVGTGVKVGAITVGELSAKADAASHRATVLVAAPALKTQVTSTVIMEGEWPFELTLEARNTQLETTPASSFDATVRANGLLAQPEVKRATASISNLRLTAPQEEILSDGPIELSYADGRLQVGRLALKSGSSVLRVKGEMPIKDGGMPGSLSLEGSLQLEPLSKWLAGLGASQIGGVAEVSAVATGSAQHWQPAGSVTIQKGSFHSQSIPIRFEDIAGRLNLRDGLIHFDQIGGKAGTGTLRIGGSLPLRLLWDSLPAPAVNPDQPARVSAQLDKLQLSGGKGAQAATATFGVKMEGEASALSLSALRASVEFNQLEVTAKSGRLGQAAPTRITIADGAARLERLDIQGAGASLKASGSLGLAGDFPLQFDAVGSLGLGAFGFLAAPIEAAGTLRLDVHVKGTLDAPQTTGYVDLDQASLALPFPQVQAGNVKMHAVLEGDRVTLKQLSGTLNGGAFTGGGDLKLGRKGVSDANLSVTGKNIFLEFPASVKTTSSLDLKLVSRKERLVLEGRVDVQEGFVDASIDLFSRSSPTLNLGAPAAPGAARSPIALDVRIVTKRPVELDNNLGRLASTADLRLAGTITQPRLLGKLDLEQDGRLYFGDRTYYIERGTVSFLDAPRITPELNIQTYTRTGDYTVKLGITGEPNEITTTFTSDPPLSRDDVIAVLLTGKTVSENRGVDVRSLEAFSLATSAMNASLSSKLHRSVGVSRVSIQPAAISAESKPGARVTITQDFTRSWRLLYSMNLSDSNDQIWITEYDLSRKFTTRVVKDSENDYRGEFRHDVRFGGPSPGGGASVRAVKQLVTSVEFTGAGPFSPAELAKVVKLKPGKKYNAAKLRKASERLTRFLMKKGYLESRVRMDRQDHGQSMSLTLQVELGPTVELACQGKGLPGRQKKRLRNVWHNGISDQQRPQAVKNTILGYFTSKGYLNAQVESRLTSQDGHKVASFSVERGRHYSGVKAVVEGAQAGRAPEILALIRERDLEVAVYREPRRVAETVTRFYQQRGFLAAKVTPPVQELDAERGKGQVVIAVEEGPLFRFGDIRISGNKALPAAELLTGVPIEKGIVFEPARLEPTLSALKLKYGQRGYSDAQVDYDILRNDERAAVDVSFTVVENRQISIGAIKIEGNRQTSEKFARGQLKVAEGDVANTVLVRESLSNLSQTSAYASADIQMRPPVEAGASDKPVRVADMVVSVAEPKPFRLLYGTLYDSGSGPGFIADFQNQNLLGPGRTLGLRTRYDSETNEARIYLTQPFLRQRRLSTTFSIYYTKETEYLQTTPTHTMGASIQQDFRLPSKMLLSYGYRFEKQRGYIPDPAAPEISGGTVAVAPLMFTVSRDRRDNFLDATRGSFMSHGFEFAPHILGSDYPYLRYYLQYFKYFPLTRPRPVPFGEQARRSRLVFATGTRVGMQKGFNEEGVVLTDRFFAGGGTTVRGFKQDDLGPKLENGQPAGGNATLILNEELRFPLFWIFDAVTFLDVGNVFPRVTDFKFSELRTTGGFGLRIRNPFVVLRFDYGFKFDRRPGESMGAFYFSIGQAF